MSDKTLGQVVCEAYWRDLGIWQVADEKDMIKWDHIAAAVIAHARPKIEAEARAAAVEECASASAPPGFQCVPVEPDLDMVLAGAACGWPFRDIYGKIDKADCQEAAKEIYKAMLAAARQK